MRNAMHDSFIEMAMKTGNPVIIASGNRHQRVSYVVDQLREHESDMTTAIMLGAFDSHAPLKKEFYDICMSMKGHD